jgi:hypothetical protein
LKDLLGLYQFYSYNLQPETSRLLLYLRHWLIPRGDKLISTSSSDLLSL